MSWLVLFRLFFMRKNNLNVKQPKYMFSFYFIKIEIIYERFSKGFINMVQCEGSRLILSK